MMQKVGIVGLGLIGGSLGLDLRSQGLTVLGVSRQWATCERAIARGIVDQASPDGALLAEADLIFLCAPIAQIAPTLQALVPHLQPATIVTDVGSVKAPIVEQCSPLWANFIGGHPMAGTEAQGVEAGQRDLFAQRPYVLTPTDQTEPDALETLSTVVKSLGSRLYLCEPAIHDRAVAWISHLPVMISASLIESCLGESDPAVKTLAQQLASSGLRDTRRVGGGNPELGLMMAQYNQAALLRSLGAYRDRLDELITQIEQQDWQSLGQTLQLTQQERPHYLR
jgi:arogenate dehydrogenase (NADP+)